MWSRSRQYTPLEAMDAHGAVRVAAPLRAAAPDDNDTDTDDEAPPSPPSPTPAPVPRVGVPECAAACDSAPVALDALRAVVSTLPPMPHSAAAGACEAACTTLAAYDMAVHAGQRLAPHALTAQALASVEGALGDSAAATLRASTGGAMTPAQALAADALAGTLRPRPAAAGWQRVDASSPPLAFPADHGLHANVADEWYFVVGVLHAQAAAEAQPVAISFCWMLDWRLLAPEAGAEALSLDAYVVDAQFAVAEAGAPNVAHGAAVWGGAAPLSVRGPDGLLALQAGGMRLRELASDARDGLGAWELAAANPAAGTLLAVTIHRDAAVAPFVRERGSGIVGDVGNGNGNYYYSAPFLAVAPGGRVVTVGADGGRTARVVTGGVAWFDHQLGTLGRPTSPWAGALWRLVAAAAPASLPIVDRGFGVAGQENWWGLMFTAGPLAGRAFMGTVLSLAPVSSLRRGALVGNWITPDGAGGAAVTLVNAGQGAEASATAHVSDGGSLWASAFRLRLPDPDDAARVVTVTATNLAADGFMRWSKGDLFSEAALVLTASDGSTGYGWAEQVGWDRAATAALLGVLRVPDAAAAARTWEVPPAWFKDEGVWLLVALSVATLAVLALAGWAVVAGVHKLAGNANANANVKNTGPPTVAVHTLPPIGLPPPPPAPSAFLPPPVAPLGGGGPCPCAHAVTR